MGDKTPTTTPTTTTTTATPSTPTETEIEEARKIINIEHPQESQKRLKEKFPNKTDEEIKELVRLATGIK